MQRTYIIPEEKKDNPAAAGGIGAGTLFALLFTYLKLTGSIDWGWIWVLAPLWVPLAGILMVLLAAVLVLAVVSLFGK